MSEWSAGESGRGKGTKELKVEVTPADNVKKGKNRETRAGKRSEQRMEERKEEWEEEKS